MIQADNWGRRMSVAVRMGRPAGLLAASVTATMAASALLVPSSYADGPYRLATPPPSEAPQPAPCPHAPTALSNGTAVAQERDTTDHVVECYTASPASYYWAVFAAVGTEPRFDANLWTWRPDPADPGKVGSQWSSFTKDASGPEWVALDFNAGRFPSGPEHVDLWGPHQSPNPPPAKAKYLIQYVQGRPALHPDDPTPDQQVGFAGAWLVDIRDVNLVAGKTYTIQGTGLAALTLLRSDPDPKGSWTWAQSTHWFNDHSYHADAAGKITLTAPTSGWYGLVVESATRSGTRTVRITTS